MFKTSDKQSIKKLLATVSSSDLPQGLEHIIIYDNMF